MSEWIEPIWDRTENDVAEAKQLMEDWKKTKNTATMDLKGCLNSVDLNRIENNIGYISAKLSEAGYDTGCVVKKWEREDLPTYGDVERILNNLKKIQNKWVVLSNDVVPDSMLYYEEINDIEHITYKLRILLDGMYSRFQKSNSFKANGTRMLPIRR